jgi:hypothetical protein
MQMNEFSKYINELTNSKSGSAEIKKDMLNELNSLYSSLKSECSKIGIKLEVSMKIFI